MVSCIYVFAQNSFQLLGRVKNRSRNAKNARFLFRAYSLCKRTKALLCSAQWLFNPSHLIAHALQASIRAGGSVNVPFRIREPEIYPVDLYYLMDTSYSMKDDLQSVKQLAVSLGENKAVDELARGYLTLKFYPNVVLVLVARVFGLC